MLRTSGGAGVPVDCGPVHPNALAGIYCAVRDGYSVRIQVGLGVLLVPVDPDLPRVDLAAVPGSVVSGHKIPRAIRVQIVPIVEAGLLLMDIVGAPAFAIPEELVVPLAAALSRQPDLEVADPRVVNPVLDVDISDLRAARRSG